MNQHLIQTIWKDHSCLFCEVVLHPLHKYHFLLVKTAKICQFCLLPRSSLIIHTLNYLESVLYLRVVGSYREKISILKKMVPSNSNCKINKVRSTVQTVNSHSTALRKSSDDQFSSSFLENLAFLLQNGKNNTVYIWDVYLSKLSIT